MLSHQLVGQFIEVSPQHPDSEGGIGTVKKVHPDGSFDIDWVWRVGSENNIPRQRIKSLNGAARPPPQTSSPLSQHNIISPPASSPKCVSNMIIESRGWSEYDRESNPLLVYLHHGKKKEKGWLRLVENEYDKYEKDRNGKKKGEMKSQLSEMENNKLVAIKSEIDWIALTLKVKEWPSPFTPTADLSHAYGVSAHKVRDCVIKHLRNNCTFTRKIRSDAGSKKNKPS